MSDKPWLAYKKKIKTWAFIALLFGIDVGATSTLHSSGWGFIGNLAAGLIGLASAVIVGLMVIGKYDTMRLTRPWVPARNEAFKATAHQICTLVQHLEFTLYMRAGELSLVEDGENPYKGSGRYLQECGNGPSYGTADKLHGRAERINKTFAELPSPGLLPSLASGFRGALDLSRIDRIRSLAFPLLAGTQDQSTIEALNAIQTATLSAYFLYDHLIATHSYEWSQHQGPDLIADFLRKLEDAYRLIVEALETGSLSGLAFDSALIPGHRCRGHRRPVVTRPAPARGSPRPAPPTRAPSADLPGRARGAVPSGRAPRVEGRSASNAVAITASRGRAGFGRGSRRRGAAPAAPAHQVVGERHVTKVVGSGGMGVAFSGSET
jgi:hypothetical protein